MPHTYGPPPPPPPTAPSGPHGHSHGNHHRHGQALGQRDGHSSRGGRGGHNHRHKPNYNNSGYGPQQMHQQSQPFAQPNPSPYSTLHALHGGGYGPNPQQAQHWHFEQGQVQGQYLYPQNYGPQGMYPPQQTFNAQAPYVNPSQPAFGQTYPASSGAHGPSSGQWQPEHAQSQGHYGGHGRGGGGAGSCGGGYHQNDHGGHKAQMMGPPIRMGFDHGNSHQPQPVPVGHGYPAQPYPGPQAQAYPSTSFPSYPAQPFMYDSHGQRNGNTHPRSGHHAHGHGAHHNNNSGHNNNMRPRNQFGHNKMRDRKVHHTNQKSDAVAAAAVGKKKKRKTNTLGLTPGDESEDDDDDENEEQELVKLIGDDAPNPQDMTAWLEERRRNFPTGARVEAKKQAATKAKEAQLAEISERQLEQEAEKLRKQLEKVESSIKRKREQQDEGDDMRNTDASTVTLVNLDSDDEKPESMPTRPKTDTPPSSPPKVNQTRHCKYYSTGGTCGKKGKCRFVHDEAVREAALRDRESNGGRMTLQQRLVLNDKEQEDLTIVKTLKYLQDKGLFEKKPWVKTEPKETTTTSTNTSTGLQSSGEPPQRPPIPIKQEAPSHLPPIPPPTVRSDTPRAKYDGWDLSGFGNTGVRSGDL